MNLYPNNEYRATKDWPYAISAGCVVYRKINNIYEILLLPRDIRTNKWGRSGGLTISHHLPKGHVEFDETLSQTAERETQEEAGVSVKIKSYLGAREDSFTHPNTNLVTIKTVHYFVAEWVSDLSKKDDEHDSPVWVAIKEAKRLLGPPMPKGEDKIIERLEKYLELTDES